jgi:hypothetical protein
MTEDLSQDLEECWAAVRRKSPIRLVSDKASNIEDALTLACEKTSFLLAQKFKSWVGQPITTERMVQMISHAVQIFMEQWHEGLRNQNLAGLIEIVLEGQDLPPDELQGFIRALPKSLLERIARSALGSATGVHGLLAIEHAFRKTGVPVYTIARDPGSANRICVSFTDTDDQQVKFFLDETFDL